MFYKKCLSTPTSENIYIYIYSINMSLFLPVLSKLEKRSDPKSTPKSGEDISSGLPAKVDFGRLPLS